MANSYIDLPADLQALNVDGRYDHIIKRAKNFGYHDFKFDCIPDHPEYGDCLCPKAQLVDDLSVFPELAAIRKEVMHGKYDDNCDEVDELRTRAMLLSENAPDQLFIKILGQDPPTREERENFKKQTKLN
jgi:hypothetical protein